MLIKDTGAILGGAFEPGNLYVKDVLVVTSRDKSETALLALTGVLNSKVMRWYYETSFPTIHVQKNELYSLPLPSDVFGVSDREPLKALASVVEKLQSMALEHGISASNTHEASGVEGAIAAAAAAVDRLVYDLYGLTEDEIALVEARVKGNG